MLVVTAAIALVIVPSLARRSVSVPRLMAEAFITTIATVGVVWPGWGVLWLIEQRW